MTNTESFTELSGPALIDRYEQAARELGYVEDPGIDGLCRWVGPMLAVLVIDRLDRAEVRVQVMTLSEDLDEVGDVHRIWEFAGAPVWEVREALQHARGLLG